MAWLWEQLAGDTRRFAVRLAFAADPHQGRGAAPDLAASWGSFELWVDGLNLCAHVEGGERVEAVHWYLLPLIEWFAEWWNPLLQEERLPVRNAGSSAWQSMRRTRFPPAALEDDDEKASVWEGQWQGWWRRHALRAASDGGLFPDVVLRRWRESVEISWGQVRSAGMPDGFAFAAASGTSRVAPAEVAVPLHRVLLGATEYLLSVCGDSERLATLRKRLQRLARSGQRQERLAWLAGLGVDGTTMGQGLRRAKRWLADLPGAGPLFDDAKFDSLVVEGSCQGALMYGCLAPDVCREDVVQLAEIMVSRRQAAENPPLAAAVPVADSGGPAWEQGYRLAEDAIDRFGLRGCLDATGGVDLDRALAHLEIDLLQVWLADKSIRGVAIAGARYRPCVAWNENSPWNADDRGYRFTLAHELCHVLFDWEHGRGLAIASGPWAPVDVESRANAFAAMLLMPPASVKAAISELAEPIDTVAGVRAIASRLRTSFNATAWHLVNLGFLDEDVRARMAAAH